MKFLSETEREFSVQYLLLYFFHHLEVQKLMPNVNLK